MNEKQAKNLVESLIFSADEPLSKEKIKKILCNYGNFNFDELMITKIEE